MTESVHPLILELRRLVADLGITQAQLATDLGVSERTVAYWLHEDVVPQRRLRRIIQAWIDKNTKAPARTNLDGRGASRGRR